MGAGRVVRGPKLASLANKANLGIGVVAGAAVGINLLGAIDDPHLLDIARITRKAKRTGELSIMDEVFVWHDLMQITNDMYASSYGWNYWREEIMGIGN